MKIIEIKFTDSIIFDELAINPRKNTEIVKRFVDNPTVSLLASIAFTREASK
jgi:hypothetical protein